MTLEEYKSEMCKYCKNNKCTKNILVIRENKMTSIKCLDYLKNEKTITRYKRIEPRTAKYEKTLMGLVGTWN